jgi:hypothetical protein
VQPQPQSGAPTLAQIAIEIEQVKKADPQWFSSPVLSQIYADLVRQQTLLLEAATKALIEKAAPSAPGKIRPHLIRAFSPHPSL